MRQLLEAGVHFGHQTRRWNPKMRPFIFAERNGIHIIDLAQTVKRLDTALEFARETVARGDTILFVGTKKQAQEPIAEEATRADMPYVNQRWLGGMLTNFVTIRKRLGLLEQLEARQQNGDFERMSKKEASRQTDQLNRLLRMLGGMRRTRRLPGALFVIDPQRERIAITEARKLEIPIIGTGDTNVDPDLIDYIIPANDDAIRAIRLLCTLIADAALEGAQERTTRPADEQMAMMEEPEEASDEMVAALAAGGTFSFEPEPDEDERVPAELLPDELLPDDLLPGEGTDRAEAAPVDEAASADMTPAAEATPAIATAQPAEVAETPAPEATPPAGPESTAAPESEAVPEWRAEPESTAEPELTAEPEAPAEKPRSAARAAAAREETKS
jgi:small subunit ribosomal protein S2